LEAVDPIGNGIVVRPHASEGAADRVVDEAPDGGDDVVGKVIELDLACEGGELLTDGRHGAPCGKGLGQKPVTKKEGISTRKGGGAE
jgi:hypothetical protein